MNKQITIDSRYCGPPKMANGGYVSGQIAAYFHRPVEITIRKPVPLDRRLSVEWFEDVALLCDQYEVVAAAQPTRLDLDAPAPPSYQEAVHATRFSPTPSEHPFPECFVCGPCRPEGDGLRIFPGPLERSAAVAAPWVPHARLASVGRLVDDEYVYSALDCPGGHAAIAHTGNRRPVVLGRYAVSLERPVVTGERYIVVGWRFGGYGRKHLVGTALYSASGRLHAVARATWLEATKAIDAHETHRRVA